MIEHGRRILEETLSVTKLDPEHVAKQLRETGHYMLTFGNQAYLTVMTRQGDNAPGFHDMGIVPIRRQLPVSVSSIDYADEERTGPLTPPSINFRRNIELRGPYDYDVIFVPAAIIPSDTSHSLAVNFLLRRPYAGLIADIDLGTVQQIKLGFKVLRRVHANESGMFDTKIRK